MALPMSYGQQGYIGPETAFFGKYAATGGEKPGYTRTITYPGGVNPNWSGSVGTSPVTGVSSAASSAMQRAIAYYQEGGGYGKGTEAALERGRTKALASGAQGLISAGLGGTTMMAGLGKKFEEEVGMPTRARVEETRAQALSGLEMTKAQIIQGATESQRASALQKYLAELQSQSSIQGPTVTARQPSASTPIFTGGATQPAYKFPSAPSLIGDSGVTGRSPTASYYGDAKFQR